MNFMPNKFAITALKKDPGDIDCLLPKSPAV